MATITSQENNIYQVDLDKDEDNSITLATANTYVDKNIIINIPLAKKANIDSPEFIGKPLVPTPPLDDVSLQIANTKWVNNNYIGKKGDATINGSLTVIGSKYPLLTLKSSTTSTGYLMSIQGNLMFGDCTSNNPSRQYYGRMVPILNQAIVGAVAIGYNPKDEKNYKTTTDYGIKIDLDIANATSVTPAILRQCGSLFVGINGGFISYSGNINKAVDPNTQVYNILDSNNIKQDEYIKSLEQRIIALEAEIAQNKEETN